MMATSTTMGVSTLPCTKLSSRKAFSGTSVLPLLPAAARPSARFVRHQLVVPMALFTKDKTKDRNSKSVQKGRGYDPTAKKINPATPAFTRRREVFVGRLAMLGFASALIGEILSGKGAIGQVAAETSLPTGVVELLFLGIIGYSLSGVFNPATYSKENQQDVAKRGKGPTQNPRFNLVSSPDKTLGTSKGFGFTKKNEVFVGRTAQLGFLASLIGEKLTGKGPLTQFGLETGIPVGQAGVGLIAFITFFLVAAVLEGNYGQEGVDDDRTY